MNNNGSYTISFTPRSTSVRMDMTSPVPGTTARGARLGVPGTITGGDASTKKTTMPNPVVVQVCTQPQDKYRFGYNGKGKDNEIAGLGNFQDYGFREYDTRLARFNSVDPLTKKYPMLTPYQFASNTPIMAIDLDGAEALIISPDFKKYTFVGNVYYVTTGSEKVSSVNKIKTATHEAIINKMASVNRELAAKGISVDFQINHVTTDALGKPLTAAEARRLANNASVQYYDAGGKLKTLSGPKISTIVKQDINGVLSRDEPAKHIYNMKTGENTILVNDPVFGVEKLHEFGKQSAHEIGHFMGRWSGNGDYNSSHPGGFENTDQGITSTNSDNVELVPGDIEKMKDGAIEKGKVGVGTLCNNCK